MWHRNSHYAIFPQDDTAMVKQPRIYWPNGVRMRRVRQQVAVMVGNATKMLLPIAGKFIKNINYCIKDKV
jgi:hypothetical protein